MLMSWELGSGRTHSSYIKGMASKGLAVAIQFLRVYFCAEASHTVASFDDVGNSQLHRGLFILQAKKLVGEKET
jgi:hypothetical protein